MVLTTFHLQRADVSIEGVVLQIHRTAGGDLETKKFKKLKFKSFNLLKFVYSFDVYTSPLEPTRINRASCSTRAKSFAEWCFAFAKKVSGVQIWSARWPPAARMLLMPPNLEGE